MNTAQMESHIRPQKLKTWSDREIQRMASTEKVKVSCCDGTNSDPSSFLQ